MGIKDAWKWTRSIQAWIDRVALSFRLLGFRGVVYETLEASLSGV